MVLSLISKLLVTKQLKIDGGVISINKINFVLLPSFFIEELSIYFIKEKKIPELYMISWYWGYILVDQIKKRFGLNTPEEIYKLGMDMIEAMGIGLYKTHDYKVGKYTHFTIPNNPFAQSVVKSNLDEQLSDYFISGFMAGGGSHVHGEPCQCVEIKCKTRGDNICEFVTGTEKELKKRKLWSTAEKRYDLKRMYQIQKDIFKEYDEEKKTELLKNIMKNL